jgi:hypothetical protein
VAERGPGGAGGVLVLAEPKLRVAEVVDDDREVLALLADPSQVVCAVRSGKEPSGEVQCDLGPPRRVPSVVGLSDEEHQFRWTLGMCAAFGFGEGGSGDKSPQSVGGTVFQQWRQTVKARVGEGVFESDGGQDRIGQRA